jgi:hypothetical protein
MSMPNIHFLRLDLMHAYTNQYILDLLHNMSIPKIQLISDWILCLPVLISILDLMDARSIPNIHLKSSSTVNFSLWVYQTFILSLIGSYPCLYWSIFWILWMLWVYQTNSTLGEVHGFSNFFVVMAVCFPPFSAFRNLIFSVMAVCFPLFSAFQNLRWSCSLSS